VLEPTLKRLGQVGLEGYAGNISVAKGLR